MIDPEIRAVLDGTPIAHLASVLPDGAPHVVPLWIGVAGERVVFFTGPTSKKYRNLQHDPRVAISMTHPETSMPVLIRGRVAEWVDGDAGWALIDAVSAKYTGGPYPREQLRVAALVEPEVQRSGLG